MGLPPELEKIVAHEDREMGPHQEETEPVNLGTGSGKKEVKIGTGMTTPICEELTALLKDYHDIFAWSYQDMPGLICFLLEIDGQVPSISTSSDLALNVKK